MMELHCTASNQPNELQTNVLKCCILNEVSIQDNGGISLIKHVIHHSASGCKSLRIKAAAPDSYFAACSCSGSGSGALTVFLLCEDGGF